MPQLSRNKSAKMAVCGGSVKFVAKTVFVDTWRALGTNIGGESLTDF